MRPLLFFAAAFAALLPLHAQDRDEFFEKKVRPIFAAKCYGCHGSKIQQAGLKTNRTYNSLSVFALP